jgi:3-phenylpropionate/trans-cinnamate dioxygenase ferredoxin reductase component
MSGGIVIVGASMAGLRTAEALRRQKLTHPITVIGSEPYLPYNRPPLSKEVLASDDVTHEAVAFPIRDSIADVTFVTATTVTGVDLTGQNVTDDRGTTHPYDYLVIATGLTPNKTTYPNQPALGHYVLRSLDDALSLRPTLRDGAKVVIHGCGFVGMEVAATARKLGCEVTVVARGSLPLKMLGQEFGEELQKRHEAEGVQFVLNTTITDLVGDDQVTGVVTSSGETLDCDVFVEAIGSTPNTELLAGQDIDITDGVLCDNHLRAQNASGGVWGNVFAVGDVARFPHWLTGGTPRRIEHWNIPTDSGKHVAHEIAREEDPSLPDKKFSPVPSFWSDQFDIHIFSLGLPVLHDRATLVLGDYGGDCVVEYHRGEDLVGVAGIGHRSVVQGYRNQFDGERG